MEYQEQEGTRLRHVKHKPGPKTHEGPAVYHSLPCFELTDVPPSRQAPVIGSLDPLSILDAVEIESVASEVGFLLRFCRIQSNFRSGPWSRLRYRSVLPEF